jgi:UDPglucose--hexose-1-phosphate uridylyltransferase
MRKLVDALGNPAYNYMLHTTPTDHRESESYHWHIEVVPRLTRMAGFEFASGFYANPVPPEEAAARLAQEGAGAACPS